MIGLQANIEKCISSDDFTLEYFKLSSAHERRLKFFCFIAQLSNFRIFAIQTNHPSPVPKRNITNNKINESLRDTPVLVFFLLFPYINVLDIFLFKYEKKETIIITKWQKIETTHIKNEKKIEKKNQRKICENQLNCRLQ